MQGLVDNIASDHAPTIAAEKERGKEGHLNPGQVLQVFRPCYLSFLPAVFINAVCLYLPGSDDVW